MQNLGGQTKSITVFSKVTYLSQTVLWMPFNPGFAARTF